MSVTNTAVRTPYTGNGVSTQFATTFVFLDAADVQVYVDGALKTLTTDYSVSGGDGATGTVTFVAPPATGAAIVLLRATPLTQPSTYTDEAKFPAARVTRSHNRATLQIQQMQETLGRALKFGKGSLHANIDLPDLEAGKFWRTNLAGTALEQVDAVADNGTFTQSGTGAVARTTDAKLGEALPTPDDFYDGTIVSDVTDATAAIQAALDAHGTIGLQRTKTYRVSSTLTIPDGGGILGGGLDGSGLHYVGTGSAIESATKATARIFRCHFADFTLTGNGKTAGTVGLDLTAVDSSFVERVRVADFDVGVRFDGALPGGYRNRVFGGVIEGNNTGVQVRNAANEQVLDACKIDSNTDYGLDVQGGNSITAERCNFESNGVHVRTADASTRIRGGRMEAATTFRWQTTATASYFSIEDVHLGSGAGQAYQDLGQFSTIREIDRNAVRGVNLLRNGGLETWFAGTTSAPDTWTLSNATVAQETTEVQEGTYSALLTAGTTGGVLFQDYPIPPFLRDGRREWLALAWVQLGTSTAARLSATPQDSGGVTQGVQLLPTRQTGLGTPITAAGWQFAYVVCRPNTSATRIRVGVLPDTAAGTGTCYVDAICLLPLGGWHEEFYPHPVDGLGLLGGAATYDPPSLADGAGATTTVTVTGAALGDFVIGVSFSLDLQGITVTGYVSAADTVSVRFQNETGGTLDLASGTLRVRVLKA